MWRFTQFIWVCLVTSGFLFMFLSVSLHSLTQSLDYCADQLTQTHVCHVVFTSYINNMYAYTTVLWSQHVLVENSGSWYSCGCSLTNSNIVSDKVKPLMPRAHPVKRDQMGCAICKAVWPDGLCQLASTGTVSIQGFPAEYCAAVTWLMFFTSTIRT